MGVTQRDIAGAAVGAVSDTDTVADLRERIDVLTAFTGGIIFELDRDGRYLRIWTGEPTLLARPADELIGRSVSEVLGSSLGARFHDAFRRVAEGAARFAFEYAIDVQAGRRTFSCELRPHGSRSGELRTVTLLVRDVTAAKALEGKLLQAERLAALGLLAASVGHEIRQPLAYVLSSVDTLERELATASTLEQAQACLGHIRQGARRIAEIAGSLDVLSRQRSRTSDTVDIGRVLEAALDLCASELSHVEVRKRVEVLPPIRGDEGELCQVLANLILNAAQVPRSDGAAPFLTLACGPAPDRAFVRIAVSDNGCGIPAENLSHIFDPFFTTKEEAGGTGLGLFITRGIVEAHGGALDIASAPGRGTTVEVLLPIAGPLVRTNEPPSTTPQEPSGLPREASTQRRRLSLLVVDDESRFLGSLRVALADTHDVVTSLDAADALAAVSAEPRRYDVVLCDLAMPRIDGAAFFERMQVLGVGDRFVLMTGGAYTPRAIEFIARAECPSISKPFLLEGLLALLDDVTRGRSAS